MSKQQPYRGIQWVNSPSTVTPLSASNLNLVDAAIIDNESRIKDLEDDSSVLTTKVNTINSEMTRILVDSICTQCSIDSLYQYSIITLYGYLYDYSAFNEVIISFNPGLLKKGAFNYWIVSKDNTAHYITFSYSNNTLYFNTTDSAPAGGNHGFHAQYIYGTYLGV